MREVEKKFIAKFSEGKLCQLRRCVKLGLKNYETQLLTGMSEKQVYYWKKEIFGK